jgi:GWxTD domain-containing protein
MKRIFVAVILFASLIISCHVGKMASHNFSYLYDKDMQPFIPEYAIYQKNDSSTSVFYKFNTKSLLYVKQLDEKMFTAKFLLKCELYENDEMKILIDSNSVLMADNNNSVHKEIIGNLDIKDKKPGAYLLKLIFSDMNKHTDIESYITINRDSPNVSQNFLMLNTDSMPKFTSYISSAQEFRLQINNKKPDKLFVRYYDRIFSIATPPYSTTNEKSLDFTADSIFTVPLIGGSTGLLNFPKKGIYHFQADTSQKEGFTVFRFDDDFPEVTTTSQMLLPIRYLTSKNEYDELLAMKNKKEAIDKFWIENAGNAERAKQMIKLYYNRVQEANSFFTSYLEGWKTDRGIIYIVYGPPNIVYKGKNAESWIYGEDKNMLSIDFVFYKVENPFTDNDYSLSRSPIYKDGWYIAVDNWRR